MIPYSIPADQKTKMGTKSDRNIVRQYVTQKQGWNQGVLQESSKDTNILLDKPSRYICIWKINAGIPLPSFERIIEFLSQEYTARLHIPLNKPLYELSKFPPTCPGCMQ